MKRILLVFVAFFLLNQIDAQKKKFFSSMEIIPLMFSDNHRYTAQEWKDVLAPHKPWSDEMDSLNDEYGDSKQPKFNGGLQLRLQKILPVFKPGSKSRIEWNIGTGFHSFKRDGRGYANMPQQWDTTQLLRTQVEHFVQSHVYLDLYTSLVYTFGIKKLNFYFGAGFEPSFAMGKEDITEQFYAVNMRWSSAKQQWTYDPFGHSEFVKKPVKQNVLSLTVPVGLAFNCDDHIQLKGGMEYMFSRRKPSDSSSEAFMIQLGVRFIF